MAMPRSKHARLYYRCAIKRFEEAKVLRKAEFTTGAVYLAGYGVECILKTLVLSIAPPKDEDWVLRSFRGGRAHEYDWLRTEYLNRGGSRFPSEITQHFTLVNDWSTDLRYSPRDVRDWDADAFLESADAIIAWAKERI